VNRSRLVSGLAALATLLAATACVNSSPTAAPTPTKPAMQVLTEAAEKAKGKPFTYTFAFGDVIVGDGVRDTQGDAVRNITIKSGANGLAISGKIMSIVGDRIFAKLDLGGLGAIVPGLGNVGDRWVVVNPARLSATGLSASLVPNANSSTVDMFVSGVVTAETVSPTEIKGTVDIEKAAPMAMPASELAKLKPEQKIVPFTATVDGQGQIVKTVTSYPAVAGFSAAPLTVTYTGFGTAPDVVMPPEHQSVDAPEAIYLILP
jgi:hypothetical protein